MDAAWVGPGLLLAGYPRICAHLPASVVLVDADQVATADPGDIDLILPGRRCAGVNRRRRPCGGRPAPGSEFCYWHEPASHKTIR